MRRDGFTLTESLLALAILGVALAAILPTFLTYADTNTLNEERSGALLAVFGRIGMPFPQRIDNSVFR